MHHQLFKSARLQNTGGASGTSSAAGALHRPLSQCKRKWAPTCWARKLEGCLLPTQQFVTLSVHQRLPRKAADDPGHPTRARCAPSASSATHDKHQTHHWQRSSCRTTISLAVHICEVINIRRLWPLHRPAPVGRAADIPGGLRSQGVHVLSVFCPLPHKMAAVQVGRLQGLLGADRLLRRVLPLRG